MTAILVILLFVGFALVDWAVRAGHARLAERRLRRERDAVLQTSLKLDFTTEAPSLKRVEVPEEKARILAVDDEPVVLDSFRKILVLGGFSVDTVETGPEALGLVQRRDYDFVFTDLKMPGMDGVEVVKAVKHLRPDVDVAVITGYGTIETAVETMQHGALDYVQKPFTEEELLDFARKLLIRRQARLESLHEPVVRIAAPAHAVGAPQWEYCIPGGAFVSAGHAWARIEPSGSVRVGVDDFARKALGSVERIDSPEPGRTVKRGETLFSALRGDQVARFAAPVSGRIAEVNPWLGRDPARLCRSPYDEGWVCVIEPSDLASELEHLRIGQPAARWLQEEIRRLRGGAAEPASGTPVESWAGFEEKFLRPAA